MVLTQDGQLAPQDRRERMGSYEWSADWKSNHGDPEKWQATAIERLHESGWTKSQLERIFRRRLELPPDVEREATQASIVLWALLDSYATTKWRRQGAAMWFLHHRWAWSFEALAMAFGRERGRCFHVVKRTHRELRRPYQVQLKLF